MTLVGYSYFQNIIEHDIFEYSLYLLLFSELIIMLLTSSPFKKSKNVKKSDKGSFYLIVFGYWLCIYVSFCFLGHNINEHIRNLTFPHFFYYIGILLILIGIIIRDYSVWTLKKAFTLSVQTTSNQHLIQKGFYKYIRNPAYTGSIVSLLGIAFAFRSIIAPFLVLIICLICYGFRINIEEKALRNQFKDEFVNYCTHTYRLFPLIW